MLSKPQQDVKARAVLVDLGLHRQLPEECQVLHHEQLAQPVSCRHGSIPYRAASECLPSRATAARAKGLDLAALLERLEDAAQQNSVGSSGAYPWAPDEILTQEQQQRQQQQQLKGHSSSSSASAMAAPTDGMGTQTPSSSNHSSSIPNTRKLMAPGVLSSAKAGPTSIAIHAVAATCTTRTQQLPDTSISVMLEQSSSPIPQKEQRQHQHIQQLLIQSPFACASLDPPCSPPRPQYMLDVDCRAAASSLLKSQETPSSQSWLPFSPEKPAPASKHNKSSTGPLLRNSSNHLTSLQLGTWHSIAEDEPLQALASSSSSALSPNADGGSPGLTSSPTAPLSQTGIPGAGGKASLGSSTTVKITRSLKTSSGPLISLQRSLCSPAKEAVSLKASGCSGSLGLSSPTSSSQWLQPHHFQQERVKPSAGDDAHVQQPPTSHSYPSTGQLLARIKSAASGV